MSLTKYSLRGAIFKLACLRCDRARISKWTRPRSWSGVDWVDIDPATAPGEIQSMIETGALAWCGYHEPSTAGQSAAGWVAGAEEIAVPSVWLSAPPILDLAAAHFEDPATAKRAAKASKANAPARLLSAIKNGRPGSVAELAPVAALAIAELNAGRASPSRREELLPLHAAARLSDPTILRMLMPMFDIDAPDRDGARPIAVATRACNPECVAALLDAGADARLRDDARRTPLMLACGPFSPPKLLASLLPHSDPSARDARGRSALWLAAEAPRPDAVRVLSPLCDINGADDLGATPLMAAAGDGVQEELGSAAARRRVETAEVLIAGRPWLDARDALGRTALMRALAWREDGALGAVNGGVVRTLVDSGASTRGAFPNGDSLLTHCTRHRLRECVAALAPRCDARHRGADGETALMHFAAEGDIAATRAILARSEPDARDDEGRGALFAAAEALLDPDERVRQGALLCALALLPRCDVNARDASGETPFNLLIDAGARELFDLALPRARLDWGGEAGRSAFEAAAMAEDPHFFDALLPLCDTRFADVSGMTALMIAAGHGRVHQTRALIPLSDVDRRCSEGLTPLMWACKAGQAATVAELIGHADPRPRSVDGESAADLARARGLEAQAAELEERSRAWEERDALARSSASPTRAVAGESKRL